MSSINRNTAASLAASTATANAAVTRRQDEVRSQMSSISKQLPGMREGVQSARRAEAEANAKLATMKPGSKGYDQALQARNNLAQAAQAAQQQLDEATKKLQDLTASLPGKIAEDNAETQANAARAAQAENATEAQNKAAQDNKKASEENSKKATSENKTAKVGSDSLPKGSGAAAPADTVSAAVDGYTGAEPSAAPAAQKSTPQVVQSPAGEILTGAGTDSYSPKTAEGAEGASLLKNLGATANKTATPGVPAQAGGAKLAQGGSTLSGMEHTAPSADGTIKWDKLNDAQQANIKAGAFAVREAAKTGDVKKTEKAFLNMIAESRTGETGGSDSDDASATAGKSASKKGANKGAVVGQGAAAEGSGVVAGGGAGAGGMTNTIGAGTGGMKTMASETQNSKLATTGLVGAGAGSSGKLATVGASADTSQLKSALKAGTADGTSELGKAYVSGGVSPMELVQMVMLMAFQEAGENVKAAAETLKTQTDAKKTARQSQDGLREQIAYSDSGQLTTEGQSASNKLSSIQGNIDSIGDDNQVLMIRLQNLTQLMTTMSQAASNISKNLYDTEKSVIGQIGH